MSRQSLYLIGLLVITAVVGGALWMRSADQPNPGPGVAPTVPQRGEQQAANSTAATTLSNDAMLPDGYAGTQSCAECHHERLQSFQQTAHSHSMREVDLERAQTEAQLVHTLSKRSYDVIERDDRLWHREWEHMRPTGADHKDDDPRLLLNELPVRYVMGSGSFAEAYLLSDGDYLLQSPVTWYVADGEYGMAPGYDEANHRGCKRVIEDNCVYCHAGIVSRERAQLPNIHELAIGCERCHGPSQEHVTFHRAHRDATNSDVPTAARSLDPSTVERARLESICAQCHLNGDVNVFAEGEDAWDFRPGDLLVDNVSMYRAEFGELEDPFSDHFDQLWHSPCYQQSATLTCVTCHDPHHAEPSEDRDALFRQQCLQCHDNDTCGVTLERRHAEQQNRCVVCHMPAAPSRVVHSSTTNHRIGIHRPAETSEQAPITGPVTLRSLLPDSWELPPAQRERRDTLAQANWLVQNLGQPSRRRGLDPAELESRLAALGGAEMGEIWSVLAQLANFRAETAETNQAATGHRQRATQYARRALAAATLGDRQRANALTVLASNQFDTGQYQAAVTSYGELVTLRRQAIDHYNLGLSLGKLRQFQRAEQAFREAIRIDASYPLPYRSLSVLYQSIDDKVSQEMSAMSQMLLQNQQGFNAASQ